MKLKINWQKPETELDHVVLTMLLWYDIWKHAYYSKFKSKYYKYVDLLMHNDCPLCEFYKGKCQDCFLKDCTEGSIFHKWVYGYGDRGRKYSKEIYLLCKQKAKELINDLKQR